MRPYRRYHYKKRGLPRDRVRRSTRVWYWGNDNDWGRLFCAVRTPETPHWCIRGRHNHAGYAGWDYERNRWVCRPDNDGPKKRIKTGWRYRVYG